MQTNTELLTNITTAAKVSVASTAGLAEATDLAARQTGLLFAAVSVGFDAKIKTAALAKAASEGGYKCDDTTAAKIARAGRIVLIDKPADVADPIYGWGGKAYTAVCNAVRYGITLKVIDNVVGKAASTDEAIKAIAEAAKNAKDAKKAETEAADEAASLTGDEAPKTTMLWLDASMKNLMAALTKGVITSEHLPILRALAETAGAAALLVEAEGADAPEAETVNA